MNDGPLQRWSMTTRALLQCTSWFQHIWRIQESGQNVQESFQVHLGVLRIKYKIVKRWAYQLHFFLWIFVLHKYKFVLVLMYFHHIGQNVDKTKAATHLVTPLMTKSSTAWKGCHIIMLSFLHWEVMAITGGTGTLDSQCLLLQLYAHHDWPSKMLKACFNFYMKNFQIYIFFYIYKSLNCKWLRYRGQMMEVAWMVIMDVFKFYFCSFLFLSSSTPRICVNKQFIQKQRLMP